MWNTPGTRVSPGGCNRTLEEEKIRFLGPPEVGEKQHMEKEREREKKEKSMPATLENATTGGARKPPGPTIIPSGSVLKKWCLCAINCALGCQS